MPNKPHCVTEAELQAYVDGALTPARHAEIADYLALRPSEARRLRSYSEQNQALRVRFNGLLEEAVPARLHTLRPRRMRRLAARWAPMLQRLALGLMIALAGAVGGWYGRARQAAAVVPPLHQAMPPASRAAAPPAVPRATRSNARP